MPPFQGTEGIEESFMNTIQSRVSLKGSHFSSTLQLLAGGDNHLLSGLDLERDTSRYYYLTMGGEVSTTTSSDKKLYAEVRRAMGVSKY